MHANRTSRSTGHSNRDSKDIPTSLGGSQIPRIAFLLTTLAVILVLDQWTKYWISTHMVLEQSWEIVSGFFYITYIRNFGVAFGMFSNLAPALRQVLVLVLPCLILVLLLVLYFWKDFQERIPTLGLCLVISGAVSNLLDRFFLGYVVDFLDFDLGLMRWPAFNVADSCVTVGGIGLMIFFTFFHRPPAPQSSFRASPKASSRSS